MKTFLLLLLSTLMLSGTRIRKKEPPHVEISGKAQNLVVVTIDGVRWKEVFSGADSTLINNPEYTGDVEMANMLYWDSNPELRRKKLMPFLWNVLVAKGQLMGNRNWDNHVNMTNPYRISYAGYNELFTGNPDWLLFSNRKKVNTNRNVFEELNNMNDYRNRVALFSSWNVFPYIMGGKRSSFFINSAYDPVSDSALTAVNEVQQKAVFDKTPTRHDWLTYISAKEYLVNRQPRVLYLALGETDEYAHQKKYNLYLHHINAFDRMLGDLWGCLQSNPVYRNNTTLIVTTDHGRGNKTGNWHEHGMLVPGSAHTWLAFMGPNIQPEGERKDAHQVYAKELPGIIYQLLGVPETEQTTPGNNQSKYYAADKSK